MPRIITVSIFRIMHLRYTYKSARVCVDKYVSLFFIQLYVGVCVCVTGEWSKCHMVDRKCYNAWINSEKTSFSHSPAAWLLLACLLTYFTWCIMLCWQVQLISQHPVANFLLSRKSNSPLNRTGRPHRPTTETPKRGRDSSRCCLERTFTHPIDDGDDDDDKCQPNTNFLTKNESYFSSAISHATADNLCVYDLMCGRDGPEVKTHARKCQFPVNFTV